MPNLMLIFSFPTHYVYRWQQESIPVGCVPPACQPYVLWWSPDVRTGGPQVNKFEQVFSNCHQMSLAGGWAGGVTCLVSRGGDEARACTVRSNASWVMVTWGPTLNRMTETTENITFLQLRWRAVITSCQIPQREAD